MDRKKKLINAGMYILKVIVLFLVLYFTIEKPTGLALLLYIYAPSYVILYLALTVVLSEFPKTYNTGKGFFRRHILKPILLLLGVGVMFLGLYGARFAGEKLETARIERFMANAEEKITYMDNVYVLDIKGVKTEHSMIMIDYDAMKIGFLFYGSYDQYEEFQLEKSGGIESQNIQYSHELSSPGRELITYYPDEKSRHRTNAIAVVMEDGTVYSADGLKDENDGYGVFLGLR